MGKFPKTCSLIVLKCLYLLRIGRLDILWSVNKLARAVTKWTRSCDGRLARLISYIHITAWSYDMERHATQCVEWYCELTNQNIEQLYKADDHQFKKEKLEMVGKCSNVCSQIVLKCLYLARIGRSNILWSLNKLARAVTKWTRACGQMPSLFNFVHPQHEWLQAVLSRGKYW